MNSLEKAWLYSDFCYYHATKADIQLYNPVCHSIKVRGRDLGIVTIDSKDRGRTVTLPVDITCPWSRDTLLSELEPDFQDHGIRVIQAGMPERVIPSATWEVHKRNLKRFSRYYDESSFEFFEGLPSYESSIEILKANGARWSSKLNQPWKDVYATLGLAALRLCMDLGHRVLTYTVKGYPVAIAQFVTSVDGKSLHWVNTYKLDAGELTLRLGNTVLLHTLQTTDLNLNLGCDFFDYKKLWTDRVDYCKGLDSAVQDV